MRNKIIALLLLLFFAVCSSGCIALLAGAAGGGGTAVWLSEKLTQEVKAPLKKSIDAANSAMKSLKLEITKVTIKDDVAQIIGEYSDGKTIWIDVHRINESSSRIGVRVGAIADKDASRKILDRILRHL